MANTHATLTSLFSDIADSIRNKTGENRVLVADDFPDEIDAIETGGQPEPFPPDTPYVWTRPSNYPDLDSLTYPSDVNEVYVTIDKTLDPSTTIIYVSGDGAFYFGHIENGEFIADTGDIIGSSIDLTQYSGDILLGKLVGGTWVSLQSSNVFAETYVNVNNSSFTTNTVFKGQNIKHINIKAHKTARTSLSSMFNGCRNLRQLDLSSFNTSAVTDMSYMFYDCYSLQTLDLSSFDTSSVTSMSSMFNQCRSLLQLDLSNFDTSSVTSMSAMFSNCYSLQNLNVSSFNTSSVTSMSAMFSDCQSLQQLDLSNFDTSLVTDMTQMFSSCYNLQNLDLSSFDTSSVTNMRGMFVNCYNLRQLDLSGFNTSSVTDIGNMFTSCYGLQQLDLSSFDASLVTSMSSMFSSCSTLKIAEPFKSTLTASQVTTLLGSSGSSLFKPNCIYRSTYLSWCEIIPEGTGNIYVTSNLNYKLSDADRALLTDKGYTLSIS